MECTISEQDAILKVMAASLKQKDETLSFLEYERRLLKETNEEPIRNYGEQKTMVGKSVEKLMQRVATRFVGNVICISSAILKCCLRKKSELKYFSDQLRWK